LSATASTTRLHQLYINLAVCRDYSVRCRSACCRSHWLYFKYTVRRDYLLPAASALRQLCHSPRLLVCLLQWLYLNHVVHPDASARRVARRRLLRPHRASGCLSTSRGTSRGSSHGPSSTTSPTPRVRVPRHVTRLVIDYFTHTARPGASARHATRHAVRRRLLRPHRTSGCLGTSRDSSRGSSSTTSPTPHVRVPRHVARLVTRFVVDYFAHTARTGASASRPTHHAARRRLLRPRCRCFRPANLPRGYPR
jgi:hypothetical protein